MIRSAAFNFYSDTGGKNRYIFNGRSLSVAVFVDDEKYDIYKARTKSATEKMLLKIRKPDDFTDLNLVLHRWGFQYTTLMDADMIATYADRVAAFLHSSIKRDIMSSDFQSNMDRLPLIQSLLFNKVLRNASRSDLYLFFTKTMKFHPSQFTQVFGEYDIKSTEGSETVNVAGWDITVEPNAKWDAEAMSKGIIKATNLLKVKGMAKYIGGDLIIVSTMKGKELADYHTASDIIRVKGVKKTNEHWLHGFVHEVGHRIYFKKLSNEIKQTIFRKYWRVKHDEIDMDTSNVENGNKVFYDNTTFSIKDWKSVRGTMMIGLRIRDTKKPAWKKKIGSIYYIPLSTFFSYQDLGVLQGDGKRFTYEQTNWSLPTGYAYKNEEEMYAELFGFWIMGNLKDPWNTWMNELH